MISILIYIKLLNSIDTQKWKQREDVNQKSFLLITLIRKKILNNKNLQ